MGENRREFLRIPMPLPVAATLASGEEFEVDSGADVSATGLFLPTSLRPALGTACRIRIELLPGEEASIIAAEGRVVRHAPDGFALSFQKMDANSFEHLRRLIRLNSEDPDQAESEFVNFLVRRLGPEVSRRPAPRPAML